VILLKKKSLLFVMLMIFLNPLVYAGYITETHGYDLSINTIYSETSKLGMAVTIKESGYYLVSITKHANSTATKAYITDTSLVSLGTADFSGNLATFTPKVALENAETYYLMVDADGGGYDVANNYEVYDYPVVGTILDWIYGIGDTYGGMGNDAYNIVSARFVYPNYDGNITATLDIGNTHTLTVSATVLSSPLSVGEIQVCDGTCDYTKSIAPATEFTIKAEITGDDINTTGFDAYFYQTADTNDSETDWDNIKLYGLTGATANGCVQTGSTYCLTITNDLWTTKFLDGLANIWVKAKTNTGEEDFNESIEALTIGNSTGVTSDAPTAIYAIVPNTVQNAIYTSEGNAYFLLTHNGNINLDLDTNGDNFVYEENSIDKTNQKFNDEDIYGEATAITGETQIIKSNLTRGTYPTSSTHQEWFWLDAPDQLARGNYTTTLIFGGVAS
jgi:hypothetical protein